MGHGGKREGAGRRHGARNKATAEAKEALEALAREHTGTAVKVLVQVASKGESEAARVSAATALLDRGYGKPKQTQDTKITMTAGEAFVEMLRMVNERRAQNGAVAEGVADGTGQPAQVRH